MDTDHVRYTPFQILPAVSFVLFNMILCLQLSLMKINQTIVYQSFCHFYVFSKLSQLGLPKRKKKKAKWKSCSEKHFSLHLRNVCVYVYIIFISLSIKLQSFERQRLIPVTVYAFFETQLFTASFRETQVSVEDFIKMKRDLKF